MSSSTDGFSAGFGASSAAAPAQVRPARLGQVLAAPPVSPDRAREDARAEGYSVGWAAGQRAAAAASAEQIARMVAEEEALLTAYAARLDDALGALQRAAADLERRSVPSVEHSVDLIAAAAYNVAEAVVGRELSTATEAGLDAVRRALCEAPHSAGTVVVRLNPQDAAELASLAEGRVQVDGRMVTVVQDGSLRSGDAVAECDSTTLDARIAPALARVKEILAP